MSLSSRRWNSEPCPTWMSCTADQPTHSQFASITNQTPSQAQSVVVTALVLCLTLSSELYAYSQTPTPTDTTFVSQCPSLDATADGAMGYARTFALQTPMLTMMSSDLPAMNSNYPLFATALLCIVCCSLIVFALCRAIEVGFVTLSLFALMASTLCAAAEYDLSEPQMTVNVYDTCYIQYGQAVCWGDNLYGNLGRGNNESIGDDAGDIYRALSAIDLGPNFVIKQFAGGSAAHHCAVSIEGRLKCFGYNAYGQCGYGDNMTRGDEPNQMGLYLPDVNLGVGFVVDSVSLGFVHSCAVSTNYTAKCFGSGLNGTLGIGDTTESNRGDDPFEMGDYLPLLVFPSAFLPTQLSAGATSSCAVSTDARVCCFGDGRGGLMGQGNTDNAYEPVLVDLGDGFAAAFVSVSTTYLIDGGSACAVSTNGAMKCWGSNSWGELGYNHTDNIGDNAGEMGVALLIVDLGTSFLVKQVSSGTWHRCVLSLDGRAKCFGGGFFGQLGSGSEATIGSDVTGDDVPTVDFGVDFDVTALATGDGWILHHCALSVTADMRCWGLNSKGQLYMGDTETRLSPVTPFALLTALSTQEPTQYPTQYPTNPTLEPTTNPSTVPTMEPTREPTREPTSFPISTTESDTDAGQALHISMICGTVALNFLLF